MIAAMKAGAVALPLHRAAQRAAHHGDVGGGRSRHLREEHAEDDDDLRQPAPDVPDQRQRQIGDPHHHIGRTHEFADQQEERNRQQRFGIHAVENLLDDRRQRNVGQQRADEHARHQRKRHGHAEIAEKQKAERHQRQDDRCAHRPHPRLDTGIDRRYRQVLVRRLGMVKSVCDAVDQLLDREQRDQQPGERNRRIERGDRRARRQPETAEAPEIVDVAEPDQAKRDAENHEADDDLDDQPRRAVQGFRDRGQVEMIVAAGGDRGANENRIDEQRGGDFLQPQPGMADGARDDVARHRQRKAETQHPAKDHQDQFEPVERPPFQVMLPLQHQFVGDGHRQNFPGRSDWRRPLIPGERPHGRVSKDEECISPSGSRRAQARSSP